MNPSAILALRRSDHATTYVPGFHVGRVGDFTWTEQRGPDNQTQRYDSLSKVTQLRPREARIIDLAHRLRLWRPQPWDTRQALDPPFAVPQCMIDDALARSQLAKAPAKYRKWSAMLSAFRPDEWLPPLPQQPPADMANPRMTPFTFRQSVQDDLSALKPSQCSKIIGKTFSSPWLLMHGVPRPPRVSDDLAKSQLGQAWLRLTRFEVAVVLCQIHDLDLQAVHHVLPDFKYMAESAMRESGGNPEYAHWPIRQYNRSPAAANLAWPAVLPDVAPAANVAERGTAFTWDRSFEATFGHLKLSQRGSIGLKTISAPWYDIHKTSPLPLERTRENLEVYVVDAWPRMTRLEVAQLLSGVASVPEADKLLILPDYRELLAQAHAAQAAAPKLEVVADM